MGEESAKNVGASFVEGRLEWLRDDERRDADVLAAVLGEEAPIVLRMRLRSDELKRCARTLSRDR